MNPPRLPRRCLFSRKPCRTVGFTLIEMLIVVGITGILVTLVLMGAPSILRQVEAARDTGKIRQYSTALNLMINEMQTVRPNDIIRLGSSNVDDYAGGAQAAATLLNSKLWVTLNQPLAQAQGTNLTPTNRSYTLNSAVFPSNSPTTITNTTPMGVRAEQNKPLLFTGVLVVPQGGASGWGNRGHANPIYSGLVKTSVNQVLRGRTLVLFVGGHARVVDFSKELGDAEGWWKSPN